jgi:chloramphenicol 3-O phosphotransferase
MLDDTPGEIILLIGTSSAGKTTVGRALQRHFAEHYLLVGLDDLFRMVAPQWGGGEGGPLSREGFRYNASVDADGKPMTTIEYGPVGKRALRGFHRAVATLAVERNDIIIDEMLLDNWVLRDWIKALGGMSVFVVQLESPVDILEERERRRNQPPGLARGHLAINRLKRQDLVLDTSQLTPEECAEAIAEASDGYLSSFGEELLP